MFGGFGAGPYYGKLKLQQGMKAFEQLPRREVTSKEFVRLMMLGRGLTDEQAGMQVRVAKAIGGWTRVGNEMLRVVDPAA